MCRLWGVEEERVRNVKFMFEEVVLILGVYEWMVGSMEDILVFLSRGLFVSGFCNRRYIWLDFLKD